MIRNLKVLGLALTAFIAFSAMAASGAMAQTNGKLTSDGPVTIKGTQIETQTEAGVPNNALTAFGMNVECPNSVYTGHKITETPHALIPNGAESVTISPHYKNCITAGSFPTTVDMNGCDFAFDLGETTTHKEKSAYKVTATQHCPENQTIKVTVFGSVAKHTANEPFCIIDITPTTDFTSHLVAVNTPAGGGTEKDLDITGTVTGVVAHRESPTGSILCTKKTDELGVLHIDITAKGYNAVGESKPIEISH